MSLAFDLILTDGERRFVRVARLFHDQADFLYGVEWSDAAGKVVAVFPDQC